MSLRDTEPVPSRIIALVHTAAVLAAEQDEALLDRAAFEQLVKPSGNRTVLGTVFNECRSWGLFIDAEPNTFRVHEQFSGLVQGQKSAQAASEQFVQQKIVPELRSYILQRLSDSDETKAFFDTPFSRTLAWVLMQPSSQFPLTKARLERLSSDQDAGRSIGWTPTNNEGFVRWAHFLGFQHQHNLNGQTAYQPDPTQAMCDTLDIWLPVQPTQEAVPITVVLQRLEKLFPWLEGGIIAQQTRDALSDPPSRTDGDISPALSLALRRLFRRGLITLSKQSDANVSILTWGGSREIISHITRKNPTNHA